MLCQDAGFSLKNTAIHIELLAYMLKYNNLKIEYILAINMLVKNVTIQTRTERNLSWR